MIILKIAKITTKYKQNILCMCDNTYICHCFKGRPHLSYSIKALKSEQEDPPYSTAFLAVSPSFFALLLISSAISLSWEAVKFAMLPKQI